MPSVAHTTSHNGVELVHKERPLDPKPLTIPSGGFTAVNGRHSLPSPPSPPYPENSAQTNGMRGENHPARSSPSQEREDQKPPLNSQWSFSSNFPPPRQGSPGRRESVSSPHKRKRSGSGERTLPRPVDPSDHTKRRAEGSYSTSTSPQSPPGRHPLHVATPGAQPPSNGHRQNYWHGGDQRGSERQELEEMTSPQGRSSEYEHGDESMSSMHHSHHEHSSTMETTRAGVLVDTKKRKRVFANRTKTGCQTCRRRKKKCDEAKPECSNCIRGGFVCEGYTTKSQWSKPPSRAPISIQSKDGHDGPSPMHNRPPSHGHSQREWESHPQHSDGGRGRPIVVDDSERQAASRQWNGWSEPARAYTHPPPADYPPPPHDPRGPPKQFQEQMAMGRGPPPPAQLPPPPPPPPGYGHPHSLPPNPAMTAQLALQHQSTGSRHQQSQSQPPPPPPVADTEKDKMLRGEPYLLYAPQLVEEREHCKSALWRFNNSTNPSMGVSREERTRLFRTVLEAPAIKRTPGQHAPIGTVANGVCVEAPFTCEYGYNINIGEDVVIGYNCTILDPCRITIGARTIIGPNVSILGNTCSIVPNDRAGSKGKAFGRLVRIEEDVFIGGNVTIVPHKRGLVISKGATVAAGTVVTDDVPSCVVFAGNPGKVRHGIWAKAHQAANAASNSSRPF